MSDNAPVIAYEPLVRAALLGMVRDVLAQVAETGLPGEHHFFISFDTRHDEVAIPGFLRAKYPEEMVIVLQNRFWNLGVHEDFFEVELSFSGQRHRLVVPFAAINAFSDPSVKFGLSLKFGDENGLIDEVEGPELLEMDSEPVTFTPAIEESPAEDEAEESSEKEQRTGEVVSLDAFRKR